MADPRAATIDVVRAVLSTSDPAPLGAVLADDARWYGTGPGGGCRSRDEVLQTLRDGFAGGLRLALRDTRLSGADGVLHVELSGDGHEPRETWYLLELDDDGLITEIARYSSAQSVEHDLAIRAGRTGAGASAAGTPPVVSGLVPFVQVADVERSVAFYRQLGFTPVDTLRTGGVLQWASVDSERASLMLARAHAPIDHRGQAVLFYLYTDDLAGLRDHLVAGGLAPGEIFEGTPGPKQEMRVADPDGYVLMIAQIEAEG
jgi:catechol 2,3-dioxygenase-like lactoylglutathione lyase family enzyme